MASWVWGLLGAIFMRILGMFRDDGIKKDGQQKEKLNQAEEVLKNAKLAKDAYSRLDGDQRERLRERYGRE
jgi:hypothetical protein